MVASACDNADVTGTVTWGIVVNGRKPLAYIWAKFDIADTSITTMLSVKTSLCFV